MACSPRPSPGSGQYFTVNDGEPTFTVAERLEATGIILDAGAFLDYLTYTGLDTSIQAGEYQFDPSLSIVDVARAMQDATPLDVTFVVLPGWRMEEIAASLPTSGLSAAPDAFLQSARDPLNFPFLDGAFTNEGFPPARCLHPAARHRRGRAGRSPRPQLCPPPDG